MLFLAAWAGGVGSRTLSLRCHFQTPAVFQHLINGSWWARHARAPGRAASASRGKPAPSQQGRLGRRGVGPQTEGLLPDACSGCVRLCGCGTTRVQPHVNSAVLKSACESERWTGAQVLVRGADDTLSLPVLPGDEERRWQSQKSSLELSFPPRKETASEASQRPEEEAEAVATGAWEPPVASRR